MSDKVYYVSYSEVFANGDRGKYGEQGEVVGPWRKDGEHLAVKFPGNSGAIQCLPTAVRRTLLSVYAPPARINARISARATTDHGTCCFASLGGRPCLCGPSCSVADAHGSRALRFAAPCRCLAVELRGAPVRSGWRVQGERQGVLRFV